MSKAIFIAGEFIAALLLGFLILALCIQSQGQTIKPLNATILAQARAFNLPSDLHREYKYQVGLLWDARVEFVGGQPTTFLTISDPLQPMLNDIVNVRLCEDVTKRFLNIKHGWLVLVYSRTSPKKNYDCRNIVAIYPIQPPEESRP